MFVKLNSYPKLCETHTCTDIHMHTHRHTYIHMHTYTQRLVHMHIDTYMYIHAHTYTYMPIQLNYKECMEERTKQHSLPKQGPGFKGSSQDHEP